MDIFRQPGGRERKRKRGAKDQITSQKIGRRRKTRRGHN
jgi:hypothetical protein